jgi:hypothetical protein
MGMRNPLSADVLDSVAVLPVALVVAGTALGGSSPTNAPPGRSASRLRCPDDLEREVSPNVRDSQRVAADGFIRAMIKLRHHRADR